MIIAVDFDGTCVKHRFPQMGDDVPHAIESMRELVEAGHKLILWTVRDGFHLSGAIAWFESNGIVLTAVNSNAQYPAFSDSRKVFADFYIDDAAVGCPIIRPNGDRPYVNWIEVMNILKRRMELEPLQFIPGGNDGERN